MALSVCHEHSGIATELGHLRGDTKRIEGKLDRLLDGIADLETSARAHREADRGDITQKIATLTAVVDSTAAWQSRLVWGIAGVTAAAGILGTLASFGLVSL